MVTGAVVPFTRRRPLAGAKPVFGLWTAEQAMEALAYVEGAREVLRSLAGTAEQAALETAAGRSYQPALLPAYGGMVRRGRRRARLGVTQRAQRRARRSGRR